MKIISHSADSDGNLSAWLVARKFRSENPEFIMTDYGMHTDWLSQIKPEEKVVICDFSFENKADDMKKLLDITKNVTWIDHHQSAIDDYGDFGKDIPGVRVVGTAACMLTYIYYFILNKDEEFISITQAECEKLYNKAPLLVRLVHDHDVWRYQYGKDTASLKLGIQSEGITTPTDIKWKEMYDSELKVKQLINIGNYCIVFRDSIGKEACDTNGFEYELCGFKGFFLNNVMGGSEWFCDKIKEYDFVCSFNYTSNGEWEYNFYSDDNSKAICIDLAKSIESSGGGHDHAAGCTSKKFIFGKL